MTAPLPACPHCQSPHTARAGYARDRRRRRFRCRTCGRTFHQEYLYQGSKPGTREAVRALIAEGETWLRVGRRLGVSTRCIASALRKKTPADGSEPDGSATK